MSDQAAVSERREQLPAHLQEVAQLAAAGLPNKAIASRLDLADATVKTYLSAIFDRLGIPRSGNRRVLLALWWRQ